MSSTALEIEAERLTALRRYDILDTPPDGAFDRITAVIARLFDVPIAIVSLVDEDRIWFKSHHGIDAEEIGRDPGLCASAILSDDVYLVRDAAIDARTLANPLVAGELGLRFYAAAPLRTNDGYRLGTLCVLDTSPREPSEEQLATLHDLAAVVMDEIELRRSARQAIDGERRLLAAAEAGQRLATDLARTLQASLLPPALPDIPGIEIAVAYLPASESDIGGDFYDVFPLADGAWGVAIGDVCGKGPEAAALTAAVRYSLRAGAIQSPDPATALSHVNGAILMDADQRWARFCTLFFGRLTPVDTSFRLESASGGHPLPLLLRADGSLESVGRHGSLVGVFKDPSYTSTRSTMAPGDTLLLFTDGVSEATTVDGMFGDERLRDSLAGSAGRPASEVLSRLRDALHDHATTIRDDMAMIVLRVLPVAG